MGAGKRQLQRDPARAKKSRCVKLEIPPGACCTSPRITGCPRKGVLNFYDFEPPASGESMTISVRVLLAIAFSSACSPAGTLNVCRRAMVHEPAPNMLRPRIQAPTWRSRVPQSRHRRLSLRRQSHVSAETFGWGRTKNSLLRGHSAAWQATGAPRLQLRTRRGVLEARFVAKSGTPPIARFRFPCGLSAEPAAETIRRRNEHRL
jgi:hypothetical protein